MMYDFSDKTSMLCITSGFAASACGGRRTFGFAERFAAPHRPSAGGVLGPTQRVVRPAFGRLHTSLRPAFGRPAGLRYILAASPRRSPGLRPDCQRFYILAASPRSSAGLKTSEIKFLGGGFRCSSKIYS